MLKLLYDPVYLKLGQFIIFYRYHVIQHCVQNFIQLFIEKLVLVHQLLDSDPSSRFIFLVVMCGNLTWMDVDIGGISFRLEGDWDNMGYWNCNWDYSCFVLLFQNLVVDFSSNCVFHLLCMLLHSLLSSLLLLLLTLDILDMLGEFLNVLAYLLNLVSNSFTYFFSLVYYFMFSIYYRLDDVLVCVLLNLPSNFLDLISKIK